MKRLALILAALALAGAAEAACPTSQPTAPVDLAAGGKVCVRVTPTAAVTRLVVQYTGALGETETASYLPQTPLAQFVDGTIIDIKPSPAIRGEGDVLLTSVGPGGQGVSPYLEAIFLPYAVPAVPILLP